LHVCLHYYSGFVETNQLTWRESTNNRNKNLRL